MIGRTLIVAAALPLITGGFLAGDYVHLAINYPRYRRVIDQTQTRPVRFAWGDYAVTILDGLQLRVLVFNESGPPAPEAIEAERGRDTVSVTRLIGPFYLESISTY